MTAKKLFKLLGTLALAMALCASAAALAAGIGIGALAGTGSVAQADESLFEPTELSLAESYWLVIDEDEVEGNGVEDNGKVQP